MNHMTDRNRWLALIIVCLGYLMIVLDVTIVGVALSSIREDLGFSESSLAWVANAYLLTFGGFLLLAGRLGDLFGHRRLFLVGIAFFTRPRRSLRHLPRPRSGPSRSAIGSSGASPKQKAGCCRPSVSDEAPRRFASSRGGCVVPRYRPRVGRRSPSFE
jgi:hypothetical protein